MKIYTYYCAEAPPNYRYSARIWGDVPLLGGAGFRNGFFPRSFYGSDEKLAVDQATAWWKKRNDDLYQTRANEEQRVAEAKVRAKQREEESGIEKVTLTREEVERLRREQAEAPKAPSKPPPLKPSAPPALKPPGAPSLTPPKAPGLKPPGSPKLVPPTKK